MDEQIKVYWGSGSTPAWRVLLGFALAGVPYESRLISFSAKDTRTPEFLALNPRGKVPLLQVGDETLNESLAILAWLDRVAPEAGLFGRTPMQTGQVWRLCLEYENHGAPAFSHVVRPLLYGGAEVSGEAIRAGRRAVHDELDLLNERLASGVLVGDALTAADIVWYCGLQWLVRAATRPAATGFDLGVLPLDRWPNIQAWAARVEAIPGYAATYPPHWRES